jgi:polysaccharide export outer membrane protein
VTVIVTGFVGPYSEQIRVVGEAAKPQVLAYRQKMTILDVMIAVGGLTDFADGNGATLLRSSDGSSQQYSVRLKDLIRRGDISANVEMKPGDILIIPPKLLLSPWISTAREIQSCSGTDESETKWMN